MLYSHHILLYICQYIKIFVVCVSVCDGCGRGSNEFAGRVQNYRVRSSCHRNFLEMQKLLLVRTLRVAGYAKDAIVDACHRTNDRQEHKIIWRAGPEQDFLLTCHSVQKARQPLSRRAISLGSFTGAVDFVLQLIHLESLGSELQPSYITTFILWLITLAMH